MEFSEKVKIARKQLNLSQERFAAKLGMSFASINRWEKGHKPDMKYLTDQQVELLEELLPTLTESKATVMQSILDTFNPRRKKDK